MIIQSQADRHKKHITVKQSQTAQDSGARTSILCNKNISPA